MKNLLIIGGGLAGLSAAAHLSKKKFNITLLESSPKLGGRVYSYFNENLNAEIDNGQHIMMSCYQDTLEYLKLINSVDKIKIQHQLEIIFVDRNGRIFQLKAADRFYPINIASAILGYQALSIKERFKVIDLFLDLICCFEEDLKDLTVYQWLKLKKQSNNSIKSLWEILCVGMLNTTIEKASAEMFAHVLKEIFLSGRNNYKIVLFKSGLSKVFIEGVINYLDKSLVKILKSEKVLSIKKINSKYIIQTSKNFYSDFDFIISAIPLYSLEKILAASNIQIPDLIKLQYSPILSVHLVLSENPFEKEFYGLIGSKIHWLFNHGKYITLVTSAADEFVVLSKEAIISKIIFELELFFPMFSKDLILNFQIIKEKRATFIQDFKSTSERETLKCNFDNLYFAGDWTNTGLPGTIEGAIKSGKICAEALNAKVLNNSLNK